MAKYYSGKYLHSRKRSVTAAVIVIAAVLLLATILGFLGKTIARELLLPAFGQVNQSVTPLPDGYQSGYICLPRLDLYAVQFCAFDKPAQATAASDALRKKGGAGYVVDDSSFRVLASCYTTLSQAQSVAEKQTDENYSPEVYFISSGSVSFAVSCEETAFETIKNACLFYPQLVKQMVTETVSSEKQDITQSALNVTYATRSNQLRQIISELEALPSDATSPLISQLLTLYRNALLMIEKINAKNFEYSVDFFADIRYNYIEMAFAYCKAVENLS